jgi:hypothetical protein
MTDDPPHYREMADRCIRLAGSNPRADQRRTLRDLAEQYRLKAETIEREIRKDQGA